MNKENYKYDIHYTEFAPAERDDLLIIQDKYYQLMNLPQIKKIADSLPDILMILNNKRQVVFANERLIELLKFDSIENVLGLRPGELLNCQHSNKNKGGCGTTIFCSKCGAVNAIQQSLKGQVSVEECRIIDHENNAFDFKVWATPYEYDGSQYSIFAIKDISAEKRRNILERIFFHDITNTAGGLMGITQIIKENPEDISEFKDILHDIATTLMDEINAQKILLAAENGTLEISGDPINTIDLLNSVKNIYQNHIVAQKRTIIIDENSKNTVFFTDHTLLKRIIGNLTKNALEAIEEGFDVTMGVNLNRNNIVFWVHNPSVIPLEVQLQLFQRSFSTKGLGRGIGTYSVKLLTEKYLGGKVYFKSNEDEGTTFYVELPFKTN